MHLKHICQRCSIAFGVTLRGCNVKKDNGLFKSVYNNNNTTVLGNRLQSSYRTEENNEFSITTPIFYVNAAPHIGHLHTAVLADTVKRWRVLKGDNCVFSTGTDEHGLKVQQAAFKSGQPPQVFCDQVSCQFQNLFEIANISHTDFIRTTNGRHGEVVKSFWNRLNERGFIYEGFYEGWYCTSEEAFLTETQVTTITQVDGTQQKVSCESLQPVEWTKEKNYMFRLSEFTTDLLKWIDTGVIYPQKFESIVRGMLREGLPDLSVSRQRQRLHWGIPVPGDHTQTIYVWLDALTNYLTVAGYDSPNFKWPVNCHVVGKDILKFHAIYWPAFLMAAGLELPRRIICHSHWTVHNEKMSKSRGNVVCPFERMTRFTPDGMRYFLMKESVLHSDGNYTDEKVIECINNDLVNTLGNLLNRCTSKALNPDQVIPPLSELSFQQHFSPDEQHRYRNLQQLIDDVDKHYEDFNIYRGLDLVMENLRWANGLVQHHQPWELVKDQSQRLYLQTVLHIAMETLMICGILLQPVIPQLSCKLLTKLGFSESSGNVVDLAKWNERLQNSKYPQKLRPEKGLLLKRLDKFHV